MSFVAAEIARRVLEELPAGVTTQETANFVSANFPRATIADLERAYAIMVEIADQDAAEKAFAKGAQK